MRKNILITGIPKVGKTTLLEEVILPFSHKVGFVTREVLSEGQRIGFKIVSYTGTEVMLAHTAFHSSLQVGRFFVCVENLNPILEEVSNFHEHDLLYLDEIGQMQLASDFFKATALRFLDSPNTCIATLTSVYEDDFVSRIKNRDDILLIRIDQENKDAMRTFVPLLVRKIEKAKKYITEPERITMLENGNISFRSKHATRTLRLEKARWHCDCDFFSQHAICSHCIAVDALYGKGC